MSAADQTEKAINQHFRELMDKRKLHLRIGEGRRDGTEITLIGNVWEMHGPSGCCTCCPRGELR